MAIVKDTVIDLIQILPDRQIQVRQIRRVLEDGVVIATGAYHRFVLDPGFHEIESVKVLNDDLHRIVLALWTDEVVTTRKAFMQAQEDTRLARDAATRAAVVTQDVP
jgi:hypothetical protein